MRHFALIGEGLSHSFSAPIHECILDTLGLNATYTVLDIPSEHKDHLLDIVLEKGITGFSITMPYKLVIMEQISKVSEKALQIGAVNTVTVEETDSGIFTTGYNTDYDGFTFMLRSAGIEIKDRSALLLGSGGAARAILASLYDNGASDITVYSKSSRRFDALKKSFPDLTMISSEDESLREHLENHSYDCLVNSTPVGMYPERLGELPIDVDLISRFSSAADVIYNPSKTRLLECGIEQGLAVANGLNMLIFQAIRAEELFWNTKFSDEDISKIVEKCQRVIEGR